MAMQTSLGTVQANGQNTGALAPMLNAYAIMQFLVRALPYLVFEKFGQAYALPEHSTKHAKFRRYEALDNTPVALVEGVTPASQELVVTDLTATLTQYGGLVTMSDVLIDTDDTQPLKNVAEVVGEQIAQILERIRIGILLAGTNVEYAGAATSRATVDSPIDLALQRRITRKLKNKRARFVNTIIRSTPDFYTENVAPGFVAVCHPDCESDIRQMKNFVDVKNYGVVSPWENEIGVVEQVRYLFTDLMEPWADSGAATTTMVSTSGANADVYPILYIAKDSYGLVPFKGANAVTPIILNPTPSPSDPLGQRGHVAWKTMTTALILNQSWLVRAEVAVSQLTTGGSESLNP